MEDKRNPYLILGLDFGATSAEASDAFARVVRRIKKSPDVTYGIEDATWALHQIEQAESDHQTDVTIYRVPADASILSARRQIPPIQLERQTLPDPGAWLPIEGEVLFESLRSELESIGGMPAYGPAAQSERREERNQQRDVDSRSHLPTRDP